MARYFRRTALALSALPALWSCGSTEPEILCETSTRVVDATVTVAEAVVFDWSPSCEVFLVLVEPAGEPDDVWGLITEGRNGIAPPVTFGEWREGTEIIYDGELLVGEAYTLTVHRLVGGEEVLVDVENFVR